ncbi:pyridoxamine 5'-phosphate oxidase [Frondihabitans sucicola]|uniref:Pyridoxamine 5'-phosphate oxidase n=1 Tax=Frondihabitans sucicola TaxID=1268041 RepID=A0ABM8GS10_9MICO|nr:pyridoxal 5'-phosphate synthase [Frondihabitans sucicola]BDZ51059.1 pyridoxamine 5'-phosphate oxidase [Frondihabitans sucicola]
MTSNESPSIRDVLRKAKVFPPDIPAFDPDDTPEAPLELFTAWLTTAVEGGVVQPHAMTLSTASPGGDVTARTLLLKDVDDALWFATSSLSPKGRQLNRNPRVALTLYWREQGRQVRILGEASRGPRDVSARDFTARHPDSRAVAIALRQSAPIESEQDATVRFAEAKERIAEDDSFAPDDWTAYRVAPTSVEFWQATTGRDQVRLRYDRAPDGWTRTRLWP